MHLSIISKLCLWFQLFFSSFLVYMLDYIYRENSHCCHWKHCISCTFSYLCWLWFLLLVIFCVTTMLPGGEKIRQWKHWENSIRSEMSQPHSDHAIHIHHHRIFKERAGRYWRKFAVVSWMVSFFKQFYGSVTKSDYFALRRGFIRVQLSINIALIQTCNFWCMSNSSLLLYFILVMTTFGKFILILPFCAWLIAAGWHSYFWLSFLPLVLLLLVGAKLEHIITELAQEVAEKRNEEADATPQPVKVIGWLANLRIASLVLYLIHFILFQNSFEICFSFLGLGK
ncbi:unnamed protein product [Coffea canephora]|uniref:DH200=94 genomic scaffold, scaffold_806 n=1 Tax=Coffea canephora TaxID=49390 RepID=A0A068VGJ0_COFCA|nr:unnamed protein product [Coffea canephora]